MNLELIIGVAAGVVIGLLVYKNLNSIFESIFRVALFGSVLVLVASGAWLLFAYGPTVLRAGLEWLQLLLGAVVLISGLAVVGYWTYWVTLPAEQWGTISERNPVFAGALLLLVISAPCWLVIKRYGLVGVMLCAVPIVVLSLRAWNRMKKMKRQT